MPDKLDKKPFVEKPVKYLSLKDNLSVIFRHKRKAISIFIVIMSVVVIYVCSMLNVYKSEGKLLIRNNWEKVNLDPIAITDEGTRGFNQPKAILVNTTLDILKGRTMAEKVVDQTGPEEFIREKLRDEYNDIPKELNDREKAVMIVMQNTDAEVIDNTNTIKISFTAHQAELAQKVTKNILEHYNDVYSLMYRHPDTLRFIKKQADKTEEKLKQTEIALMELKKLNHDASVEMKIDSVKEEVAWLKNEQKDLCMKLNQVNLEKELAENNNKNCNIIQQATLPMVPEDSKKTLILLAGFVGAVAGGIITCFVFASFDNQYSTKM